MGGIFLRRLLLSVPIVIGISMIVFLMMHLAPGDPAEAMLGPLSTPATLQRFRHDLGLDRPLPEQYVLWAARATTGDLGNSIRLGRPVLPEVLSKFWASLLLATVAFIIAVTLGLAAGITSALSRGGLIDSVVTAISVVGVSIPPFFLGMLLIIGASVKLGVLPPAGMYDIRGEPSVTELIRHLILPAVTLSAAPLTVIARMTRASMTEVIRQDFIRTAQAKGLAPLHVTIRHALRNAVIPIVSVLGLQVGYLLSATALVELVFSWPGLGSLLVGSVLTRDLPLAQGAVLVIALVYVLVNILSDLAQAVLDPRVQFQ